MEQRGYMVGQNLYDIEHYARISLNALEHGVDVIPDWIHHKIATARTHMKDVGHHVRYNVHAGRRYGDTHEMCKGALRNISQYSQAISKSIERGATQELPEWAENKLAVAAEYMDCVGHYLEQRGDGRSYSGPDWQMQHFQKTYGGRRTYAQVEKIIDDRRSVAAVGGVRWVQPPASPGVPYRGERRYSGEDDGRRFGVPGKPYGTPGWAGQGGVAQRPLMAIRGARNKRGLKYGPPQTYGSLGYGSMGDGSMDLAASGGGRQYAHTCEVCGGDADVVPVSPGDERRYGGSPDLKDPFRRCFKVIGVDGEVKEICVKTGGGGKIKSKGPDLKDPFEMKRGPQLSARSGRGGRRGRAKARGKGRRRRGRRHAHTCAVCGGDADVVPVSPGDERRYGGSPDLKDPFRRCFKVIGVDGEVKEICVKTGGGGKIKSKGPDLKDPFEMKRGPQLSARSGRGGRRSRTKARGKGRRRGRGRIR